MVTFVTGLAYFVLALAAAAAFILFVAGRFIGGILDDGSAPAPDSPLTRRFGRWINGAGDNGQRAAGTILIAVALIAMALAGLRWYRLGKDEMVFVLSAVTAGIMFFYLSANEEEKKSRGIQTSWLLTIAWVGFILVNVFVANNAEWFPARLKTVQVEQRAEMVIPTPTGTVLSVPEIFGPAWETYLTSNKTEIEPGLALNLATGGFELRWNDQAQRYEMRSTRIMPRTELARGEYRRAEDIRLAQKAAALDAKETDIVQAKRAERLEAGKIPLLARFSAKEIAFVALLILVGLGLMAYTHEEKKVEAKPEEKKPTDPKAAAPKAA